MSGSVYADIRGDEDIISYSDFGFIEHGEAVVGEKILAYLDVCPVVAVERLDEREVFPGLSEELFQQCASACLIGRIEHVVSMYEPFSSGKFAQQRRIRSIVQFSGEHFLFLSHIPVLLADSQNPVDYVFLLSSPWQAAKIFLIVQFYGLAAASHKRIGHFGIRDGKFELIGLYRGSRFRFRIEPCLDDFPFVCLENVALVDHEIQFSGLDPLSEYEIKPEKHEKRQHDDCHR